MVSNKKNQAETSVWDGLTENEYNFRDEEYPKVSVIIPTSNSASLIAITLESLIIQDYPDFEIIIIDASSTDRTVEIIKSFRESRLRIYSVSSDSRYEMLNKGITHAKGVYLNFLFPGDYYIYQHTLKTMMTLGLAHRMPSLVYCGTLIRDGKKEVKILYRELSLPYLHIGKQPTSLQSCWFRLDIFKLIGKFDTSLTLRGGYDLFCRFLLNRTLTFTSTDRILTDYDLRSVTRKMVIKHFIETRRIIYKYFGFFAVCIWLFRQKDIARYAALWYRSFKVAVFGKS